MALIWRMMLALLLPLLAGCETVVLGAALGTTMLVRKVSDPFRNPTPLFRLSDEDAKKEVRKWVAPGTSVEGAAAKLKTAGITTEMLDGGRTFHAQGKTRRSGRLWSLSWRIDARVRNGKIAKINYFECFVLAL